VVESRQNDAGEWKPSVATIKTLEEWTRWHGKMGSINRLFESTAGGAFIGINPVKEGSQSRSNDNVSAFRHVLVEWDKDQSLAEQAAKIEASGLPVSVMLTSGGKSVHAWVRVDAKDREEWNARRDFLFEQLKCDTKNKDLARVSRCPGALRADTEQKVLAVNLGPRSWAEWEQRNEWVPESFGAFDLVEKGPDTPPEVIKGVLRRSCVMQISSGPKMRKSYLLIDLAFSVQAGLPWLGLETVAGPVFYLDAENQAALIRERLPKVAEARGVTLAADINDRFRICPMRHKLRGKTLPEIVAGITRTMRAMPEPPVLAILEPLYLLLRGAKEKEAEEVTLALEELDELCREIGCAIVFVHHFSKGSQTAKASMDRASGSGALSRFPDAIVTLTPPDEPKGKQDKPDWQATVSMDLRWFAPRPEFKVWWKGSHYEASPKTVYVVKSHRDGSYADQFGEILANMPKLKKHHNDHEKCAVAEWVAANCKLGLREAWNVFQSLRKEHYDFVQSAGDGFWVGRNQAEVPF
jgi:RecA-family ATPase